MNNKIAYRLIIFLAGLQSVPDEYYEAADIDGANAFQKFRNVTFPLIRPSFNINLLICIIWGIRVFDIVFALTGGGPGRASEVLNTMVFEALGNGFYGYGVAINLIIVLAIIGVSMPLLRYLKAQEVEKALAYPKWICDEEKMKLTNNGLYIHPMPLDRGHEVTDEVASGQRSICVDVAENRLHVQKAVMAATMK